MELGEAMDSFHIFVQESTGFSFNIGLVLVRGMHLGG